MLHTVKAMAYDHHDLAAIITVVAARRWIILQFNQHLAQIAFRSEEKPHTQNMNQTRCLITETSLLQIFRPTNKTTAKLSANEKAK